MTIKDYTSVIKSIKESYKHFDKFNGICRCYSIYRCSNYTIKQNKYGSIPSLFLFDSRTAIIYLNKGNLMLFNNGVKYKLIDINKLNILIYNLIVIDDVYNLDPYNDIWIKYFMPSHDNTIHLIVYHYNTCVIYGKYEYLLQYDITNNIIIVNDNHRINSVIDKEQLMTKLKEDFPELIIKIRDIKLSKLLK